MEPERPRYRHGLDENEEKAGGLYSKTGTDVNARLAATGGAAWGGWRREKVQSTQFSHWWSDSTAHPSPEVICSTIQRFMSTNIWRANSWPQGY